MIEVDGDRPPRIFFITFGAGDKDIKEAAKRLGNQALGSGFFDYIEVLSESDLPADVMNLFSPLRFDQSRGFGFWAWKPYLINKKINSLRDGDVLVYLDAGFEINPSGGPRFTYYLDFVARNEFLVFPIPHQHRSWVKPHSSLKIEKQDYFRNQVYAGFIMLKVGNTSKRIVRRWYDLSFDNGGSALTDLVEKGQALEPGFMEHRHDQAILSHVVISEKLPVLDRDETSHTPWINGYDYPFLCLRNRTGVSRIDRLLNPWPIVLIRVGKNFYVKLGEWLYQTLQTVRRILVSGFQRIKR